MSTCSVTDCGQPTKRQGFCYGHYNIVGETTWVGNDPDVFPQRMSSVRNSGTSDAPATIAHSTGMYSSNLPFIEAGITVDELDIPHAPLPILWNTPGTHSQVIPPWVDTIEGVGVGNGGGGAVSGSPDLCRRRRRLRHHHRQLLQGRQPR